MKKWPYQICNQEHQNDEARSPSSQHFIIFFLALAAPVVVEGLQSWELFDNFLRGVRFLLFAAFAPIFEILLARPDSSHFAFKLLSGSSLHGLGKLLLLWLGLFQNQDRL